MLSAAKLFAWIEMAGGSDVTAAYLGGGCVSPQGDQPPRTPARSRHESVESARAWVHQEATMLGLSVEWLQEPPRA